MKSINFRFLLLLLLLSFSPLLHAQSDDWLTWTNFKVKHAIDSRFSLSGGIEFRTEDNLKAVDRWGIAVGGDYGVASFLKLNAGYETHYRNLGGDGWKFRHRYYVGGTASARYQWLKISLRERFQQTFDRGDCETVLRSRLKLAYAPSKGIVSPYFSLELYQNIGDISFWRTRRMRYRPGVEFALAKSWGLDVFYCYEYRRGSLGKNIIGIEASYSF